MAGSFPNLNSTGKGLPLSLVTFLMCGDYILTTGRGGRPERAGQGMTFWPSNVVTFDVAREPPVM